LRPKAAPAALTSAAADIYRQLGDALRGLLDAIARARPLRDDRRVDRVNHVASMRLHHRQRRRLRGKPRMLRGHSRFGHRGRHEAHVHRRAVEAVKKMSDVGRSGGSLCGESHTPRTDDEER
jgi:hypothetical protein